MRDQPGTLVPEPLRAQFEQIAARAAAAGRPLAPMPTLELATRAGHGSRAFAGRTGTAQTPRVRLSRDLLEAAPADRAWTIAHELSHVLRSQEGARLEHTRGHLAAAGVFAALAAAPLFFTVPLAEAPAGWPFRVGLVALTVVGLAGLWAVLVSLTRREETATDLTAALVFGEVLSLTGVTRLVRDEGALSRCLPTVIRSHPHPSARRQLGLAAAGQPPPSALCDDQADDGTGSAS